MSLNARYVQVGGKVRAAGHNAVVDDLNALANPRLPVGGQPRWLFESNYGRQTSLYGTTSGDFTSGTTISLLPCDANSVSISGASAVTVTIPTSWGTVNLLSATVGGATTTVTCKIASGTLLQYAYAGATPYLLGLPPKQFVYDEKMTATGQQIQVAWLFGSSVSTVSAWMPVYALGIVVSSGAVRLQFTPTGGSATDMSTITTEESDVTPCS
jgi:hypothetical protein